MEFSEEENEQIDEAVSDALGRGQASFDDLDFAAARADLVESMIRGNLAELILAGQIGMVVDDDGTVKYTGSKSGRP